ncbi:SGNH/GDSL hydrolase family protein [Methylomicrobium lacus]|uniref:SGNH/GDSL hydrolase family protein n=1 Tax=Methylomicrobium lacus TaxID=136992 RepID=UPI0035A84E52
MNSGTLFGKKLAQAGLWLALTAPALAAAQTPYDRIVTFGASLTDPGNGFFLLTSLVDPETQKPCGTRSLSVPPYDQLDELTIPEAPYAKGGHHFTNGETWVEYLARALKMPGDTRPALKPGQHVASNYAVGGARSEDFPCRFNLPDQIDAFDKGGLQTTEQSLFVLEIGGNDVRDVMLLALFDMQLIRPAIERIVGNISATVEYLHTHHNARQILLVNVPDIGKTPAVTALDAKFPGLSALATYISAQFNGALANAVANTMIPAGVDARILNLFDLLNDILAHPASYGIIDAEHACVTPKIPPYTCKKPDTYLFWDGIHPTRAIHQTIAKEAAATLSF